MEKPQSIEIKLKTMLRKLHCRITISWFITALVPLAVFIFYLSLAMGPRAQIYMQGKEAINKEIWQLENWNQEEKIYRQLNQQILTDSDKLIDPEYILSIRKEPDVRKFNTIIVIRKGNQIKAINDFESEEGKILAEQFKEIESPIFPIFGTIDKTHGQELLEKTGYTVDRQTDFYFKDGEEGSIFFLGKVFNVSAMAYQFATRYFKTIFAILLIFLTITSIHGTRKLSTKLKGLVLATHKARDENFDYRIKNIETDAFGLLGEEINHMLENLEKGQNYRKEIEENRQNFISNLTHDLKTPLTAIKIHIDSIQDGLVQDPEKLSKYYNNMQTKLKDINMMLDELKIFNELDIGREKYKFQEIDLNYYIQDLLEEFRYEIDPNKIKIEYQVDQTKQYKTMIDPDKMKRLITNIWSNSLKYVKKEPIEIEMKLQISDENQAEYLLSIKDNGQGVPEDQLQRIFKQHHRVDPSRNQNIAGSGLGLAICKRIAEEHRGSIIAINNQGLEIQIRLNSNKLKLDELNYK